MTLAIFGQWFTRKETRAEQAGPWIDYLARSSHLLQQGRFVADIAYLYGEGGNITELFGKTLPAIPTGYAYFINGEALVHALDAKDGRLMSASGMSFVHRRLDDGEVYFVSNPGDQPKSVAPSFRVSGRAAEVWRADTGTIEAAGYSSADGRTTVPLTLATLDAGWRLTFPDGGGADAKLWSWTASGDSATRSFSGTATYTTIFKAPNTGQGRVILDLGQVKNLASVILNGKAIGTAWKAPFALDVTDALKPGSNQLQIKVSNLWPNRLIGDHQPDAKGPKALATFSPFPPNAPLLPSGLIGPDTLIERR